MLWHRCSWNDHHLLTLFSATSLGHQLLLPAVLFSPPLISGQVPPSSPPPPPPLLTQTPSFAVLAVDVRPGADAQVGVRRKLVQPARQAAQVAADHAQEPQLVGWRQRRNHRAAGKT